MTDILVVGYPKSGNTWVTRLVAELVGCPSAGFWGEPDNDDVAKEGLDRKSPFRCFKAHHQLHELGGERALREKKLIYVVRDPRDIVVSGAHYFPVTRWRPIAWLFARFPGGRKLYENTVNRWLAPPAYRLRRMFRIVVHGSAGGRSWIRIPWKQHVAPYRDAGCFQVKYEDLLHAPERECERILNHLGLERDSSHIRRAIEAQSFHVRKAGFRARGESAQAEFLRAGKSGQWRAALSPARQAEFSRVLANELERFGYPVDGRDQVLRTGYMAEKIVEAGDIAVVALVSPYAQDRADACSGIANALEVFVDAPASVCMERDCKGLWAKARAGEIEGFTGLVAPYERPLAPALTLPTADWSIDDCVSKVIAELQSRSLLPKGKPALFVGRWSPLHNGHRHLIERAMREGPVAIGVRCTPVSRQDPWNVGDRIACIRTVYPSAYVFPVPDIDSIQIGRAVGYEVVRHEVSEETAQCSATEIRARIESGDSSWREFIPREIAEMLAATYIASE